MAKGCSAAQIDRLEIHILNFLPRRKFSGLNRVVIRGRNPCVVERNVDATICLHRGVKKVVNLRLIGDIHVDEETTKIIGSLLAGFFIHIADDDGGALGGHTSRSGEANATSTTGNHRHLAGEALGEVHCGLGHTVSLVSRWG